jgi:hypothetical protein
VAHRAGVSPGTRGAAGLSPQTPSEGAAGTWGRDRLIAVHRTRAIAGFAASAQTPQTAETRRTDFFSPP